MFRLLLMLVVLVASLGFACGGGGGGGSGQMFSTLPPDATSATVPLSGTPVGVSLGAIASGASASIGFSPTANNTSGTATLKLQSTPPNGIAPPSSLALGVTVTPLAYLLLSTTADVLFFSMPTITFTLPSGAPTGKFYLAYYDSSNATGWHAAAGPVNASGSSVTLTAPTLHVAYFAKIAYAYALVESASILPAQVLPMGVDYGLHRRCIRTPSPGQLNFYSDNTDCRGGGFPTSHYWLTVAEVESAVTGGSSCLPGTSNGQSVLINGPGSPITLTWTGSASTGYTFDFRADYTNIANACPPPTTTATGPIDNYTFSNAALPRPDRAVLSFDAIYNRTLGSNGLTLASAEMSCDYQTATSHLPVVVSIVVALWFDPGVYKPLPWTPPDVPAYSVFVNPGNGITYYTVVYDGALLTPPIALPLGSSKHITIAWGPIVEHAIAEGLVPPPLSGWLNSGALSADSVVGIQIYNYHTGPGGPMADLAISNYQLTDVIGP
jgi:hypothetical protein